ncbi:MAG: nucleotidyltransferase domain-containing protein [archaeon]|nr:nucleotidyltransferase domain-containing protein [archaeon]
MVMIEQLKEDFEEFKNGCMGILLFGSYAGGKPTKRSDIDVCIVKPLEDILDAIYGKLGGKYDIKVFENLPLYVKMEVIRHHWVIYGDELDLSEYFYFFRRLWQDMEYRIAGNEFKDFGERMRYRRKWLNEKEKILREIGSV